MNRTFITILAFVAGAAAGFAWGELRVREATARHQITLKQAEAAVSAKTCTPPSLPSDEPPLGVLPPPPPPQFQSAGWNETEDVSQVDGRRTVIASIRDRDGSGHVLTARCKDKRLEAFFITADYVAGSQQVKYRLDEDEPVSVRVTPSASGTGLFFADARGLLQSLVGKHSMILRYRPYQQGDREISFAIQGNGDVLAKIFEACPPPKPKRECNKPWPEVCDWELKDK